MRPPRFGACPSGPFATPRSSRERSTSSTGGNPEIVEEIELKKEECAGRLLEIKKAPKFLENSDWVADAPHAEQLRRAWNEWRDRIDGDPPG